MPLVLFAVALAARLLAAAQVDFPPTEVSAYYTGVARNVIEGRGLVTDAVVWYGTPPLVLPKPAFELWMPLPTFLSVVPMALFGPTFSSAQLSTVLLGALAAPLAWAVALDAASRRQLPADRSFMVAAGSGLLAALLGAFLIADVAPESTTAFTVLGVLACWLMPRALAADTAGAGHREPLLSRAALGVVLGLAYLARQEALVLGGVYALLLVGSTVRSRQVPPTGASSASGAVAAAGASSAGRTRAVLAALLPTLVMAALAVAPWLVRNLLVFGTLLPGHALQHAWLTSNEEIFAYAHPPTLERFLAQGPGTIAGNQLEALGRNLLTVLVVPAMPVGAFGLLALAALRRSPALGSRTALGAILIGGLAVYLFTSLLFPIASAWGIYRHAAGPFLVGLTVLSMLGLDALVAAARRVRGWPRSNAWLAPAGALALVLPFGCLQAAIISGQARDLKARFEEVRLALESLPDLRSSRAVALPPPGDRSGTRQPVVSDHPIWLAETIRGPVLALPDEPPGDVWRLARAFGARLLVVVDRRGRHPEALLQGGPATCFDRRPVPNSNLHVFEMRGQCLGAAP